VILKVLAFEKFDLEIFGKDVDFEKRDKKMFRITWYLD